MTFSLIRRQTNKFQEKQDALRAKLLTGGRDAQSARTAIGFCEMYINEYEDWFIWNEGRWHFWQIVILVGGVVATLAGVITLPAAWLPDYLHAFSWMRGVPAGIVTIAAGFLSSFTYKEDAVRHELTTGSLWNELAKFQTYAAPYNKNDADDVSIFVNRICELVDKELHGWSALVEGRKAHEEGKMEVRSIPVPEVQG